MISVQVTCDTGKTWTTAINGTTEEARAYFIGNDFVDEDFETGAEIHNIAVQVNQNIVLS